MKPTYRTTLIINRLWILFLVAGLGWGCTSEVDKARGFVKAQQYDEAAKIYEKILKEDKNNVAVLAEVTKLFCEGASYSSFRCLGFAKRLHKKKQDHPKVAQWLSRALYANAYERTTSGELDKAENYLQEYLKLEPKDGKAYYIGAMIKFRLGKNNTDEDDLRSAIKRLDKAIKNSSPSDTIKLDPKDKQASPLQWEANVLKANILEMLIIKDMTKFEKENTKKGAKFQPKEADFNAAVEAYEKAHTLNKTQANKKKTFYPYFQIAMFHFNFKKDQQAALDQLLKAEKLFPKSRDIVNTIRTIYRSIAEKLTDRRSRKKRKEYEAKAKEYAAKLADMPK